LAPGGEEEQQVGAVDDPILGEDHHAPRARLAGAAVLDVEPQLAHAGRGLQQHVPGEAQPGQLVEERAGAEVLLQGAAGAEGEEGVRGESQGTRHREADVLRTGPCADVQNRPWRCAVVSLWSTVTAEGSALNNALSIDFQR
jgi:hypothetical protein